MRSGMMLTLVLLLLGAGSAQAQKDNTDTSFEDIVLKTKQADKEQALGTWSAADQAVRERMKRPTDISVIDSSLPDVIDRWRQQTGINITLSPKLSAQALITEDVRVNMLLRNVPLDSVLDLLAKACDLGWYVDQETLIITTEEDARTRMTVRDYELEELNAEDVIRGIQTTASPEVWQAGGGQGRITVHPQDNTVLIWQNQREHDRIGTLLGKMKQASVRRSGQNSENPFGKQDNSVDPFGDPPDTSTAN